MSDRGSNPPEEKPKPEEPAADPNTLNIKIVSTNGEEVFFKIKKTTKLNKLKTAYADRVGTDAGSIRYVPSPLLLLPAGYRSLCPSLSLSLSLPSSFPSLMRHIHLSSFVGWMGFGINRLIFDGERILDNQTAADLDLEDGDSLDVVLQQVGGC
ncbi:hypothetical protein L198_01209 [Cryptococcus wingfieldii CBS 7118]|uniref:Ubiquitin-like domain-containing protein n=1 Tax=Cryptococcus wingfieldii CBS 7118 TaxID=1295528 RepID=A0A1E3K368_9TREE|nr:hypothetical protein L198_01209 [Cryptococcus wingfieldii CBS 7118]ODO07628.1 hypothetical protein L198_01209 [Cryptococcus wingfieldii CBS 7118]